MATIIRSQQIIPGPRFPFLSPQVVMRAVYFTPYVFASLHYLHKTYGNVVALIHGDPSIVLAFGPELNCDVLTHPDLFHLSFQDIEVLQEDLQDTTLGRLMRDRFGLNTNFQSVRRLAQASFHKQYVGQYYESTVTVIQQQLERWQEEPRIDIYAKIQHLIHAIRLKLAFGAIEREDQDRLSMLLAQTLLLMPRRRLKVRAYSRVQHLATQLEASLHDLLAQKRATPDADTTSMLATLINWQDKDGKKLSDEEIIGHAFFLFEAGYNNTITALTWAIFLLSQHPRIYADLLDELEGGLHGSAPTLAQLSEFSLLDGVVKESLRLLTPSLVLHRKTTAPCELGGFALPEGATVFISPFITHRNPALYEQPNRFLPERWANLKRSPYEYLPFGNGQRRCVGAEFAMQEMKTVLAILVQRYRLSIVPNSNITLTSQMNSVQGVPAYLFPQDRQFQHVQVRGTINQLIDFVGT
jgi:cytochrome P450